MKHSNASGSEWDVASMLEAPSAPDSLKEAGLTLAFINDLILKALYIRGGMIGRDLAQFMCLPFKVVREGIKFLKDKKLIEVMEAIWSAKSLSLRHYRSGTPGAQEAMQICAMSACAGADRRSCGTDLSQAVTGIRCTPDALQAPFSHW